MRTRSKVLLIALVGLAGIAAAGYAAAPVLIAAVASYSLSGEFEVSELRIDSAGLAQIDVAALRINNSRMQLDAQHGVVRYDLWPFRIRKVDVGRATLNLSGFSTEAPSRAVALPAPPPFPLRIDEFRLQAETPWGPLTVPAYIETRPDSAGGFRAELRSDGLSAVLTRSQDDRLALVVNDGGHTQLLSVKADAGGGYPVDFSGSIDPGGVGQWIRTSAIPPPELKTRIAAFDAGGNGLRFRGSLQEALDFTMELQGGLTLSDRREAPVFARIEIEIGSGYTVTRSGDSLSGSGDATFRFALDPETTLTGAEPAWRWSAGGVELNASQPRLVELGFEAASLRASTPGLSPSGAEGEIAITGLRMTPWPQGLAFYDVNGEWSLTGSALHAAGSGTGDALPRLDWTFDSQGDQGRIDIASRHAVAALAPGISRYTEALARETTITSGELDARYRLEWHGEEQDISLSVHAGQVDADLDEMKVRGLEIGLRNQGDTLDRLAIELAAPTLELAAGTVAEDLELKARLEPPVLSIDAARTRLLGGVISIRPASIDLSDDEFTLFADIGRLSLDRIMALFELESTQLTGEVSGPVRVLYSHEGGIEINEGELHSVEPGVLRFSVNPDSETAAQFDNIALKALENFQYDELNASVLYKPDGEYRITARILGNNPEVLDGHPIALNPTIEGRLPALFRAFFVTGDFNRAIIERLQEERSSSTSGEAATFQND